MSSEKNFFRRWLDGQVDWSAMLEQEKPAPKAENDAYKPRWDAESARQSMERGQIAYTVLAIVACIVFAAFMLLTVANLPGYGSADAPTVNGVAERYVEKGTEETGAVNTVAGMILDYRAFDTLGESFVLFTAMCAVTMLMNAPGRRRVRKLDYEVLDYYQDPIIRTVCKFVIPIILVFGVYILLNGHLSPGGGFSGGAIMASALIIYGLVWGGERASKAIPATVLKIIAFGMPGIATQLPIASALRGAGDSRFPLYASAIGIWVFRVLVAPLFVYTFGWGLNGAWYTIALDQTTRAVVVYLRFRTNKWMHIKSKLAG